MLLLALCIACCFMWLLQSCMCQNSSIRLFYIQRCQLKGCLHCLYDERLLQS